MTMSRARIERGKNREKKRERERVKVRHYNTHRGLPKGLTINCASHQMPTRQLNDYRNHFESPVNR